MSGRPLRVGIVGVGNCASAFVQGLAYYRDAGMDSPGLSSVELVLDRGIGGPVIVRAAIT